FMFKMAILDACITWLGLSRSTAKIEFTFATLSGRRKHEPTICKFCGTEQSPSTGVAEMTTGALKPRSIVAVCVWVKGPYMLSSPAETVLVKIKVAWPPQHAKGNAVPGSCGDNDGSVAFTSSGSTTVMSLNGITASGTPSPLTSHVNTMDVGVNPHSMNPSVTSHKALIMPFIEPDPTAGWLGATVTGDRGTTMSDCAPCAGNDIVAPVTINITVAIAFF